MKKLFVLALSVLSAGLFSLTAFAQTAETATDFLPKLKWAGDLRYRARHDRKDGVDNHNFQQLRARLSLKAEVNEDTQAILRLESSTSATSGNQVLGDPSDAGMPRRYFGIDQAYINWNYLEGGQVWLGRTANPFWAAGKSQVLFDSDLAFEGLAVKYSKYGAFANLAGYIISDNYKSPNDGVDQGIVGGDLGYVLKASDWAWTSHIGHYSFVNTQNAVITNFSKSAAVSGGTYRGNYVNSDGAATPTFTLQNQFEVSELGSEWKQNLGEIEYVVWLELLKNQKGGPQNSAQEYGAQVKHGRLALGFAYMIRKANSVLGAYTDDDFSGGGTDNKGSRLTLGVEASKNISLAFNHYWAKTGISTTEKTLTTTRADVMVTF